MSKKSVRSSFVSSVMSRPRLSSVVSCVERAQVRRLPAERGPVIDELDRDLTRGEVQLHGRFASKAARRDAGGPCARPILKGYHDEGGALTSAGHASRTRATVIAPCWKPEPRRRRSTSKATTAEIALEDLKGKTVVFYFYPKDSTPGCTREAQAFTAQEEAREARRRRHRCVERLRDEPRRFRDKYGLGIDLLSDPDLAVHKAYGAYGEKTMYGKKVMGDDPQHRSSSIAQGDDRARVAEREGRRPRRRRSSRRSPSSATAPSRQGQGREGGEAARREKATMPGCHDGADAQHAPASRRETARTALAKWADGCAAFASTCRRATPTAGLPRRLEISDRVRGGRGPAPTRRSPAETRRTRQSALADAEALLRAHPELPRTRRG